MTDKRHTPTSQSQVSDLNAPGSLSSGSTSDIPIIGLGDVEISSGSMTLFGRREDLLTFLRGDLTLEVDASEDGEEKGAIDGFGTDPALDADSVILKALMSGGSAVLVEIDEA